MKVFLHFSATHNNAKGFKSISMYVIMNVARRSRTYVELSACMSTVITYMFVKWPRHRISVYRPRAQPGFKASRGKFGYGGTEGTQRGSIDRTAIILLRLKTTCMELPVYKIMQYRKYT
jgi:hypothetical protein